MKMKNNSTIEVVLLGGKGTIGSGLRKFLIRFPEFWSFSEFQYQKLQQSFFDGLDCLFAN